MTIGPVPLDHIQHLEPSTLTALQGDGIQPIVVTHEADLDGIRTDETPSLAYVDLASVSRLELRDCARRCTQLGLPMIVLVPPDRLVDLDASLGIDDFVLLPPRPGELVARARWVLNRRGTLTGGDVVRVGDLVINTANFEVFVKGRRVSLRYKEYELLLLMASNPGRVYTRETLLNRIWGYDYLGGTRTVDVHVRRLRSKIEDSEHLFIETVWQVGYRFRDPDGTA